MQRVMGDFKQLAAEARQLAGDAVRHEQELVALVELLESRSNSGAAVAAVAEVPGTVDATAAGLLALTDVDLLARIRQLCVNARANRLRAERCAAALTGEPAHGDGDAAPRPRVLVVDDAPDIRDVIAIALGAAGIEVITAADGLEALIAAHSARPAVILMDVNMPVLNGIEATRLLRAAMATRDTPVIAHTARPDLLAGPIVRLFEFVVPKPAGPEEIVAAVKAFLGDDEPRPDVADGDG